MADTLEQLVGRLARRDDPRTEATVQADVEAETLVVGTPPPFLEEVYAMVAAGQSRQAVSRVFAELDARLLEGDFGACGGMLAAVDVARLDPTTALAFLAISLPAQARLPARADLVARVEAMLQAHDPNRAARLLEGLRG